MAKEVIALKTFIGTSEEVANHGGKIPEELKKFESNMSQEEKDNFRGKITAGSVLYVSDARAKELEAIGLVKIEGDASGADDKKMAQAQGGYNAATGTINVNEKNSSAGPNRGTGARPAQAAPAPVKTGTTPSGQEADASGGASGPIIGKPTPGQP